MYFYSCVHMRLYWLRNNLDSGTGIELGFLSQMASSFSCQVYPPNSGDDYSREPAGYAPSKPPSTVYPGAFYMPGRQPGKAGPKELGWTFKSKERTFGGGGGVLSASEINSCHRGGGGG